MMFNRRFSCVAVVLLSVLAIGFADKNYGVGNRRVIQQQQQLRDQQNPVPNWNQLFALSYGRNKNGVLREIQQQGDNYVENYDDEDDNDNFDDEETMDDVDFDVDEDFDDGEKISQNDVIGFLMANNENIRFPMQQFEGGASAGAILVPDGLLQIEGQNYFDEESGEQSLVLPRDALNEIPEGSIVALIDGSEDDLGKANKVVIRRRKSGNKRRRGGNKRRRVNRRRGNRRNGNRRVNVFRGRPINVGGNNAQRRRRRGNRRRQPTVIRVPAF